MQILLKTYYCNTHALYMHTKLFLIYCNDVLHLDLDSALIALQPAVLAIPN